MSESIECICGGSYTEKRYKVHCETNKHKTYMFYNDETISLEVRNERIAERENKLELKRKRNLEYKREYNRKRREDPEQKLKECKYIKKKRQDPEYRKKEREDKKRCMLKNNLTESEFNELVYCK